MEMLGGGPGVKNQCRKPDIIADAAYSILCKDSKQATGYFYIDEHLLKQEGITDFSPYLYSPGDQPMPDFFMEGTDSVHFSQYTIQGSTGSIATPMSMGMQLPSRAKEPAQEAVSSGGGEITQIFAKITGLLDPDIVKKTNAIFQFDVKGDEGGLYFLDLKTGAGSTGKGESPAKSDVTIAVSQADFVKLFTGKLSPTSAYMMGKLKIKGDLTKAMVLDKLMGKLKSKL